MRGLKPEVRPDMQFHAYPRYGNLIGWQAAHRVRGWLLECTRRVDQEVPGILRTRAGACAQTYRTVASLLSCCTEETRRIRPLQAVCTL